MSRGGGSWNRFAGEGVEENGREEERGVGGGARLGCPPGVGHNLSYQEQSRNTRQESPRGSLQSQVLEEGRKQTKKNTETFRPCHNPTEMRILYAAPGLSSYPRPIQTRDVLLIPDMFCTPTDLSIYNKLHSELSESGLTEHQIWASWHGDSHLIANDKVQWKQYCPTFHHVLDTIRDYFNMSISATRLNWYRNSSEWKPFHHDASALNEDKAKKANLTVAISFGLEREAAFEHATTKTVISMPSPNGSAYVFARDINMLWRHGIRQMEEPVMEEGRISVIAWGWAEQVEA